MMICFEALNKTYLDNLKQDFIFVLTSMKTEVQHIIIETLREHKPEMIGIFGSYARGESSIDSDLDILVRFQSTLIPLQLIHLEDELSQKLGIKVGSCYRRRIEE